MKKLAIAGMSVAATLALAPAAHASESFTIRNDAAKSALFDAVYKGRKGNRQPVAGTPVPRPYVVQNRWGHNIGGRWFAGFYAPGGWQGYRAPYRGFVLPGYWVNPAYSISNYRVLGLPAPSAGWGWSRYYDDAVLRDQRGYVQDYRPNLQWDEYGYAPEGGRYGRPDYGPSMGADRSIYDMGGAPTYTGDDGVRYDYQGQWTQGRYVDSDGRVFEGQWNGTVTRQGEGNAGPVRAGAPYPMPPQSGARGYPTAPGYAAPYGYDRYERCLRTEGVAGAAIGAVIGAVAGNRIAGRGDRTAGSLIGGGLGALAGLGVEKSMKKCRKFLPDREASYAPAPGYPVTGYPETGYPQQQGYYPGSYYYSGQPVVTTITISQPVTTTTVTEEVYYETVPVKRKAVRKWKPKPKPRCVCR